MVPIFLRVQWPYLAQMELRAQSAALSTTHSAPVKVQSPASRHPADARHPAAEATHTGLGPPLGTHSPASLHASLWAQSSGRRGPHEAPTAEHSPRRLHASVGRHPSSLTAQVPWCATQRPCSLQPDDRAQSASLAARQAPPSALHSPFSRQRLDRAQSSLRLTSHIRPIALQRPRS
jgi:hypothetical protein